jgi:hypothetical protein
MMSESRPPRAQDLIQKGLSRLFPEKVPEAPAPVPREASKRPVATLAAVAQHRIQFLDNAKRPLYQLPARGTTPLSRDEEQVALARCLEALHEAKAAGTHLGKPAQGAYLGRDPAEVMGQACAEDVKAFLAFVLANPRSFMQRPVRLSDAFLAWLVDRGEP